MEEKKPQNPPAFPVEITVNDDGTRSGVQTGNHTGWETGMALRDYFAAKAMQGICVNAGRNSHDFDNKTKISKTAYEIADFMLKERENTKNK